MELKRPTFKKQNKLYALIKRDWRKGLMYMFQVLLRGDSPLLKDPMVLSLFGVMKPIMRPKVNVTGSSFYYTARGWRSGNAALKSISVP